MFFYLREIPFYKFLLKVQKSVFRDILILIIRVSFPYFEINGDLGIRNITLNKISYIHYIIFCQENNIFRKNKRYLFSTIL